MMFLSRYSETEDDDGGVVWRDLILTTLLGFVMILFLILPHLNPPTKQAKDNIIPPGSVIIEIFWPDEIDVDVDLWVQAPGDIPVGYSNKGGVIFNLLRDDLGTTADVTKKNYEIAFSRGFVPGEYTVNVHLYRDTPQIYPISVNVVFSIKASETSAAVQQFNRQVELFYDGEEVTAFRFTLTSEGQLVTGSVHKLFKPLRSATISPSGDSLDNR